jgi:hypothetical protein
MRHSDGGPFFGPKDKRFIRSIKAKDTYILFVKIKMPLNPSLG